MGDFLKLQYELREMEQELKIRTEQNAELYAKLCNALMQIKDANNTLKYFANSTIGIEQEDGRYICGMAGFDGTKGQIIYYDPRPAKKYLEKWGVK